MRIDAHQHFWALARGDYGWLTPDLTSIYQDFTPDDLAQFLGATGIGGTVLNQAAPTEAARAWTIRDLRPCVDHLLETLGPSRLNWGRDWLVYALTSTYQRWFETTCALLSALSDAERNAVLGGNAARAYNLRG